MEQAEGRREGEEKEVKKLEKKEEVEEERPTPGWGRAEALPGQGRTLSSWGPVPSAAHFFPVHFKLGNCSVGNKSGFYRFLPNCKAHENSSGCHLYRIHHPAAMGENE